MNQSNSNDLRPVKPRLYDYDQNWISDRHREYGYNCPALDVDFFMIEYDQGLPAALIEYKHINADVKLWHPSFKAMNYLARNSRIPFFIVIYNPEHHGYYVIGMNQHARAVPWCDEPKWFSEKNFVRMLYWLRQKNCPADILSKLSAAKYPETAQKPTVEGEPLD